MFLGMFKVKYIILLFFALLPVSGFTSSPDISTRQLRDALTHLDHLFDERPQFRQQRERAIRSLKETAKETSGYAPLLAVAEAYVGVNNDSALLYVNRAIEASDSENVPSGDLNLLHARRASLLPMAGFVEAAAQEYERVDTTAMTRSQLTDYYDYGAQTYRNITAYYANYPEEALKWSALATQCHERLLNSLANKKDTPRYRMAYGQYLLRTGRQKEAEAQLKSVFETEPHTSTMYMDAAHILSHVAAHRGDEKAEMYYLVEAVAGGVNAGLVELPSLQYLGHSLNKAGDDERAYRYLNIALNDAAEAATIVRVLQTVSTIPMVQQQHVDNLRSQRTWLVALSLILGIGVLILLVMLIMLHRQFRRQRLLQQRLFSANSIKEMILTQFVSLSSLYMERITDFSGMIKRKMSAGKTDEVVRMVSSNKFANEQAKEFFRVFDDAFLRLFPTFVHDVNKLLRHDAQIELKEGERLNTDLRILAFMRMGIDDCSRMAQILNYSLNTIYAYRNKLKQRAINRTRFEEDVMRIPSL